MSVDPAGPLTPGTATHTVTVTATVADGYGWGQLGAGWLPGASDGVDGDVDGELPGVVV